MNPEFSEFISANGTAVVIVLGLLAAVGLVQWRKVRLAEAEQDYKQTLLDKGVPPADVEKVMAAKPRRRGLLEQFGELSGGAKTGVIIGGVIVFVVGVGCLTGVVSSLAFWSHVREQRASATVQPPELPSHPQLGTFDAISGNAFYLDLQPVANQKLTDILGDGHSLASLPQKRREFGGVPFQVGPGYVRLRGKNHKELPPEVTEIRVGFKFDKLHILHGTEFGAFGDATHRYHVPEGTEIGYYRVGYADGQEEKVPVVYGQDVRDAWNWDKSRPVSRGKVVWTGSSPGAAREGVSLRLYLMTWANPRPGEEVTHIDFVSAGNTAASPFCVALTAERKTK
jgi:hypothetical protein